MLIDIEVINVFFINESTSIFKLMKYNIYAFVNLKETLIVMGYLYGML